jgi:ribosomal protein S18 acetylase RimI-like enzyme
MPVTVLPATDVDDELLEAMNRLLPVLSTSAEPMTADELRQLVAQPEVVLFVARDDTGTIVGTLSLVTFRIPTGVRAWIEDVIADPAASGQGIGRLLSEAALEEARRLGARTVDLTSRPSREAANHIYRTLGFQPRDTNVYRYDLRAT